MANAIFFKVEYVTNVFDLTAPQAAFELIFQLYNFFPEAKSDNGRLYDPEYQLLEAKNSVARKGYTRFSRLIRKETTSNFSSGQSARGRAQDSFGNPPELTRAGIHSLSRYQRDLLY
jgi:hypothetical protein